MATAFERNAWVKDSGATKIGIIVMPFDFASGAEYEVQWQDTKTEERVAEADLIACPVEDQPEIPALVQCEHEGCSTMRYPGDYCNREDCPHKPA